MFKPEMIVQFKPEYTGYFRDLIGKDLTIMHVFAPDRRSQETEKVTIMEIEEIHLINSSWLKEVKNETIN
jgi:hypothetical protein